MPDRQPDNRPHLELVLRQIESLPTLPVVATRLLRLTASDESIVREVVDLISSDPTLTARILSPAGSMWEDTLSHENDSAF